MRQEHSGRENYLSSAGLADKEMGMCAFLAVNREHMGDGKYRLHFGEL